MTKKASHLGDEVHHLFESLDVRDLLDDDRIPCHDFGTASLSADDEQKIDIWRMLLVDLVQYFTLSIVDDRHLKKDQPRDISIMRFIDTLRQIDQMPDHERVILIRSKETFFSGDRPVKKDYAVFFGNIVLDRRCIRAMIKRVGVRISYLESRLAKAFEMLARYQIRTLHIEIPRESPADIERMRTSLRILAAYHQALTTRATVYYLKNDTETPLALIYDENNQPNPNLTMLSGLNDLPPEALKAFVNKVDAWMRRPESQALRKQFTSIYSALFGIKKIKEKLRRLPFEINNVQWTMLERVHDVISTEKAQLVQLVEVKFGGSPEEGAKMMECVYGTDFDKIDAVTLVSRLLLAAKILENIEDDWEYATITDEILINIKKRLECVPDDVFFTIDLTESEISFADAGGGIFRGALPPGLSHIVHFYKGRSRTKQKIKSMMKGPVVFDDADYKNIAEAFQIDRVEATELVELLAGCFDENRQFAREAFEKQIPEFARHEKSVFEFLWYYLSEILTRKERIAFFNALQHLIDRLKQPKKVILTLISETCRNPMAIKYSDRNAAMLCTILTRTYNKELHIDTEITPEEVLRVKEGLNQTVIGATARWIESDQKRLFKKIRTIHRALKMALDEQPPDGEPMPVFFLLALEREIYIFLSLIGGETAFSVIRSAVRELGDPDARIYKYKKSMSVLSNLIQLLQTTIRALARAKEREDIALLKQIRNREERFIELNRDDKRYVDLVRRAMRWADTSIQEATAAVARNA